MGHGDTNSDLCRQRQIFMMKVIAESFVADWSAAWPLFFYERIEGGRLGNLDGIEQQKAEKGSDPLRF
ncbi:MAG: hypothetical protein CO186_12825 [Zetaproteobacteria bacterium CG_4_9_14_3_um_filter_49_83]|nr:MAG: hypothetical protein CO186_12825 [Zetaproteobacteria bacterium CG_4_9_14_3_um_filter_49_83]